MADKKKGTSGTGNLILGLLVVLALFVAFRDPAPSTATPTSTPSGSANGAVPTILAPQPGSGTDPLAGLGDSSSGLGSGTSTRLRDLILSAVGSSSGSGSGSTGTLGTGTIGSTGAGTGAAGTPTEAELTASGVLLPIAGGLSCRTPVPIGAPVIVHDRGVAAFTTRQYKALCTTSKGEVWTNFASTYVWRQYHDLGTAYRAQAGVRVLGESAPRGIVTGDIRVRAIQSVPVPTIGYCTYGWGALQGTRSVVASKVC